jgi:hypothetical protein
MMQTGDMIVALVAMTMILALNWRALRAQNIPWPAKLRMALIWGVIILGVVLLIQVFQA